jgi:hypothetical protein
MDSAAFYCRIALYPVFMSQNTLLSALWWGGGGRGVLDPLLDILCDYT